MTNQNSFYFCARCFEISDRREKCHDSWMVFCDAGEPGSELRKPLRNRFGRYVSRAPRWYLEAAGLIPAWTPLQAPESRV